MLKKLIDINKTSPKQSNNTLKDNGMKSTRELHQKSKTRLNSASYSPFGRSYDNTCNDEAEENDLIPAEELSSTDRRKMNEITENINNDSILKNFYKKKIDSTKEDANLSSR